MTPGGDPLRERLQRLFREELDERLEDLHTALDRLVAAEADTAETAAALETLFRSAHSLKGAAQTVGATAVADVCHRLEDLLTDVRGGSGRPAPAALTRIDRAVGEIAAVGRALRLEDEATETAPDEAPAGGSGSLRVAPRKFDALLARAADVTSAVYRSERLVRDVAETRDRLAREAAGSRSDLQILATMARGAQDGGHASAAVLRLDRQLREIADEYERLVRMTSAHGRGLRAVVDGFADAARQARTVPFADAVAGLTRMVRDLAEETGKRAQLVMEADDVEIEKPLVAIVHDVLGHLIRNAVDHGLEPPTRREQSGKAPIGTVTVRAALVTKGIEIVVSDDGRGVALDHVRDAAQTLDIVPRDDSQVALEEMLFHPGLTTAAEVNQYSGRGVGLDAVRTQVERAGGTVALESRSGAGTTVTVVVPLAQSTLRAVVARVADDVVAFPSSAVRSIARVPAGRSQVTAGREVVTVAGQALSLVHLVELLGWDRAGDRDPGESLEVLVLDGGTEAIAVVVDAVLAEREVLLRAAPQRLAGLSLLLGTTQLADGSVALVLSPAACVRAGLMQQRPDRTSGPEPSRTPQVLLVEDTLTTRELERSILELAGYSVIVAADGAQAWSLLQRHRVDAVVSDVDMPRMDGVSLCRAIRDSPAFAELPVILVTSLHSEDDRRRGLDAGANAYLSKTGFDRGMLLDALERLL